MKTPGGEPQGENQPAGNDAHRPGPLAHSQRRARRPATSARLTRSVDDRRLGGVCGGIAEFVGVRASSVRLIYAATVPLSLGITGLGYFLLWLLIPAADS